MTMTLAKHDATQSPTTAMSLREVLTLGDTFAASGLFPDATSPARAVVKILAGQELGVPPFAAMSAFHVMKERVTMSATLMASLIKSSGRYRYQSVEISASRCELVFYELIGGAWSELGASEFTLADARAAGTKNMSAFPRNMLFARAISNGFRWYCGDLALGAAMYTPEEFGASVDDDGVVTAEDAEYIPPVTPPPPPVVRRTISPPAFDATIARAKIATLAGHTGNDMDRAMSLNDRDSLGALYREIQARVAVEPADTTADSEEI